VLAPMFAIISPKVLAYFFLRNLVTSEEFSVVVLMLFGAVTGKERGSAYWFVWFRVGARYL
jgi:hypothetical protein